MKKLIILLIAFTLLLSLTAVTFATTSIMGSLYYRLDSKPSGFGTDDNSRVDFFRLNFATYGSFDDDRADAYLTLQCQTYLGDKDEHNQEPMFNWGIQNYGYNYNLNDRWQAGVTYDAEGVTLTGGQLASNWEWIHVSAFTRQNAVKLVGAPLDTVTTGIYYQPETKEYLVKGEFKANWLKIGAGYSNAKTDPDYHYNVYTEIHPTQKSKIYLDYLSNGKYDSNISVLKNLLKCQYLIDTSVGIGPITAKLITSNHDRTYMNNKLFLGLTADFSLDYALSEKKSLTAGLVYNTQSYYLDGVYSKYNFERGYVGVKQGYYLTETHINAGYRFDHTNLLEGDYDFQTHKWWMGMAVYFN